MLRIRPWWIVATAVIAFAFAATFAAKPPAKPAASGDAAKAAAAKAARIERGRYLALIGNCGDCHTPGTFYGAPDEKRAYTGSEMGWKGPWGVHYAANLTPDLDTGVGYWTVAEFANTLRTGKRPDGTALGPPMPSPNLAALTPEDATAIAEYFMSLKPYSHAVPKAVPPGVEVNGSVVEFPPPSEWDSPRPAHEPSAPPMPPAGAEANVKHGAYLVTVLGCNDCHTPGTFYGAPDFARFLSGSEMGWVGPWGVVYAANLTPDPETGLGKWTKAEIMKAIRTGNRPDGRQLATAMPWVNFRFLTDADADAIASYLKSIPPVKHAVPKPVAPDAKPSGPLFQFPPPNAWDVPPGTAPAEGQK